LDGYHRLTSGSELQPHFDINFISFLNLLLANLTSLLTPIPSIYERTSAATSRTTFEEHRCHLSPQFIERRPCQLFAPHMASHWDATSLSPATSTSSPQALGSCRPTEITTCNSPLWYGPHSRCSAYLTLQFVSKMAHDRSVGTSLPPAFSFFPVAHAGLNTYFSPCTTDTTSSTTSPLWSIQVTLSSSHTSEHPQTLTTQRRAPQSSTPWPSPKQSGRSALFPHHHLTTGPSSYPTKLPTLCLLMISPPKLRPSRQSSRKRCGCKFSLS
jgi:hypothetical protein